MEALEFVCMQDAARRPNDFLQNLQVTFVWCNQIAATRRRYLYCKFKRASNMAIHFDPTGRRGTSATTFGAILNVNPA